MSTSPSKSSYKYKKKISNLKTDTIGDFKIGEKIGQGTFSKVCQGIHIPTGEKVAIKILPKNQIKEKSDKIRIEKEISLQKKLHHQNIIQQYSILDTESYIYIVTEYCSGGELFDYIVSKRRLPEREACRIYQQLINGLEYLHRQKICHRDLKPENLLFDSKHNLKIADFGLSNDYLYGKLSTPCGSPCYAAPEMVTGRKYFGDTVDIWSSGIVLYSMVCGYLPFEDDNQSVLFHKIAKGLFHLPSFLSNSCKDLIKNILVTNPDKRYGFEEIKKHPWFMSVNNIGGKNIIFSSPGILIDYDVIPIDFHIIKEIYFTKEYKDCSILNIVNDVIRNKHNKITTAYYLILKKKIRNNEESISNINSNSKLFIDYIKKPISKMEYWENNYDKIIEYYANKAKEIIGKEKENKNVNINVENEKIKKNRNKNYKNNNLKIDVSYHNEFQNLLNDNDKENKYIESNYTNEDIKLSTIVYDDEEKDLLKLKKIALLKKNINNYRKDTEEEPLLYKMNNYELDSDEPIIKESLDSSRNKKHFYEITKTNENIVEEENNNIENQDKETIFNKIIKNVENREDMNDDDKNKRRKVKKNVKKKNNSVSIDEKSKIKDLLLSDRKKKKNKSILADIYKKNNLFINKSKNKENSKNNINSNIKNKDNAIILNNNNKNEKIHKININTHLSLPNNSYFYKKISSRIGKDDKMEKFINKKKKNNLSQKEKEEKNKNNNNMNLKFYNISYNKINEKNKYNKRNVSQENKNKHNDNINISNTNISNGQKDSIKTQNSISINIHPKINNKINNIRVRNINNYNIDIYKYKINLINNTSYLKEMNLQEIYKKINDIHNINRYNKFISTNKNKKNSNNNRINIKKKKFYNNSIKINKNNNLIINKYFITENNPKIYKKSFPNHINYIDTFINGNNKYKNNPILLSEKAKRKREIIETINDIDKMKLKKLYNKSLDNNYLKANKILKTNRRYLPFKISTNRPNSMENDFRNKNTFNERNLPNKFIEINNTGFSNESNYKSPVLKDKNSKNNNLITDLFDNQYKINELDYDIKDKINKHSKNYSYELRNNYKYIENTNNNLNFKYKNMVYHKKFILPNKRYNNSVETQPRKKKYIMDLFNSNSNNKQLNNSLISLNINKYRNKDNIFKKIEKKKNFTTSKNNIPYNYNIKTSMNNHSSMLVKRNYFQSLEKVNRKFKLVNSPFKIAKNSKILHIKNNSVVSSIHNNKNIKSENNKPNIYYQRNIINKINKFPALICCKCSIDKIKEKIEKIFCKNDKNNSIINFVNSYSGIILKCKTMNKIYNLDFEIHISPFNDDKKYSLIKPNLIKGNNVMFFELYEKLKNELLN